MNDRIRNYIKENGMTYTFVAKRANIDIKKFSRLMNNKQHLKAEEYERICRDGLGVDPSFFFSEKFLDIKTNSA